MLLKNKNNEYKLQVDFKNAVNSTGFGTEL